MSMSALKRLLRLIFFATFILLLPFLNRIKIWQSSPSEYKLGKDAGTFRDDLVWSIPDNDDSITGLQGSDATSQSLHFHSASPKQLEPMYNLVLVITRLESDNISWIYDELPEFDTAVYTADDRLAALHPPRNKGHEVMIYLSYIISHYDVLPDIVVFMHAHRWAHHNTDLLAYDAAEMVRRLNKDYVMREGYMNMRCRWSPGCPEWLHSSSPKESLEKQEETLLSRSWNELFPSDALPIALGQACCAQFALSKERILSIPLGRFIFYRDWIAKTPLSDYISGRVWEYSWQFLFTGQTIYCPAEHICYCGGFGLCFGGASKFGEFEELRRRKQRFETELQELDDQRAQWSNNSALKYAYLRRQTEGLERDMALETEKALNRGLSPENRARECDLI